MAHDVRITKYHVSTAAHTALSTHVAEILRDAKPKAMLYLSISLQLRLTYCYEGETRQRNCCTDQRSPREIGYASEKLKYTLINYISSHSPPPRHESYIH